MRAVEWPQRHAGDVLLIGMGGSSLAARACALAFGSDGLRVADSTVPDEVVRLARATELAGAAVILASKSGTTLETSVLGDWFLHQAASQGSAVEVMAVTDAGSALQEHVERLGGRVWCNPADVGGRFSALSYFGLVPAALCGVPVESLLDRAVEQESKCSSSGDRSIRLGIILAEARVAGRDKISFVTAPRLAGFADWAEQLVAESLGKQGAGLVPITREPFPEDGRYAADRLFVIVDSDGDDGDPMRLLAEDLSAAGHPVIHYTLSTPADLGAEFLRWEVAVAAAGALMELNPFDEPDVAAAKVRTQRMLDRSGDGDRLPSSVAVFEDEHMSLHLPAPAAGRLDGSNALRQWLARHCAAAAGGYCALLAFLPQCRRVATLLDEIRILVTARLGLATTLGWGPRYLHSTGQLHKGGPPNGVYVVFTADDEDDLEIPGRTYTLGTLARAQALGDVEALHERQRPVARVHLRAPVVESLENVVELLRQPAAGV